MSYGGYEYQSGGASAAGGGGFLSQADASQGDKKSGGGREKQTLVPLTIKQLLTATRSADDDQLFSVDGRDVHQVSIVGNIMTVDPKDTRIVLKVEDLTGCIEATMWVSNDGDESDFVRARRETGVYVMVVGTVKDYNGKLSISAMDVRPIEDFDEVTHHLLETVFIHAKTTNKFSGAGGAAPMEAGFVPQAKPQFAAGAGGESAAGAADSRFADPAVEKIFNFYTTEGTGDEGLNITYVVSSLGLSDATIRKAVNHLMTEGHLYSTIDDDHHKSTEE